MSGGTWNLRFVNLKADNGGEDWLELREVFYMNDVPFSHTEPCVGSETKRGVQKFAKRVAEAVAMPVLQKTDFKPLGELQ